MIGVRWIGAGAVLAAVAACGGCSKGPRSASAGKAERTAKAPSKFLEPAPPPAAAFPDVGTDRPRVDIAAALGGLGAEAGSDRALTDGPWAGAQPGQFVTYRGAGGVCLTHKVVAVDADGVTVETSTSAGGARRNRHPVRVRAGDGAVPATAQWDGEELQIDGVRLRCRVATWVTRYGSRQAVRRLWLCDRVPGKLVRSERGDGRGPMAMVLELVRFGG